MTNCCFFLILIIVYNFEQLQAHHYPYKHYSRHPVGETIYDNETITGNDDDSDMCHLSVRCPSVPSLYPYDRDSRNRRFSVDTFLAMHGPPGPPGISGPQGNSGPRGAVGPQGIYTHKIDENGLSVCSILGKVGRSKEPIPIIAFVAYLQKMLSIESNRSEPIIFEKADINEGNGYNSTTGIFTAAYRGIYKFSVTIMAQMDSIATVRIVHNENNVLGMIRCDCRRRFSHVRGSIYAELDVNDHVMVEALGDLNDPGQTAPRNNIYGYTYTHFSGVLLFLTDILSII
ncbi:unnamed protein product [Rotaria sp. Silwood2]|nr:unnamed protein product [Rotaria sp. Silwood2]CAF2751220.1 unnamed protein product [Rotaria sp. Silwood2]CAF3027798.1 unnamed protein product [Rotaria sp. Silwood2]CAF3883859.1 unnamed protein product [Rotaria sp. Silwood2]CAF4062975.1 unnamed protein product [Rotaria sp. Silwood2]